MSAIPAVPDPAQAQPALAALQQALPADGLITAAEELGPYECDGLSAYRQRPLAVALPRTLDEVRAVLSVCRAWRLPVVSRGAGTSLSGGALPHPRGVLLSLARMNRILELDPVNRCARVEPGVRNLALSQAAAPHGLYYAPDPSSQIACTLGGNVAENAGGVHCLKYGLTVHNVLGVKMLTPDGTLHTLGGAALDGPGYDLLATVHGSEGMLGVIVEITVRLLPKPEHTQTLLAAFDTVNQAGEAVAAVIAAGILPAGLEMMDDLAIRAAEAYVQAGYPVEAGAILLCELDGIESEVSAQADQVRQLLQRCGASQVRCARDAAERQRLWAGRKAAFPAVGRLAPDYYCVDGTIPRRELPRVLQRIRELAAEYGLPVANVFHAGDGNLHPLILYDANQPGALERAEALGTAILDLCVAVGGTITGEHGVGVEKLKPMCSQFGAAELTCFHGLRAAFDPLGLMNPGKAIPTLARCAEFGRMHVHAATPPHPDLPRF